MVYTSTSTRASGAGNLCGYVQRKRHAHEHVELHDLTGKDLSEEEIADFIERSETDGFERHVFLSTDPENDVSKAEIHEKTRNTMNRYIEDRPTASYVYGIHDDTEKLHSHVALRGEKRDLWHNGDDLEHLKIDAEREFKGSEAAHELANQLGVELSQEHQQELELSDDLEAGFDLGIDADEILDADQELAIAEAESIEIGHDHDQDLGMGMSQ